MRSKWLVGWVFGAALLGIAGGFVIVRFGLFTAKPPTVKIVPGDIHIPVGVPVPMMIPDSVDLHIGEREPFNYPRVASADAPPSPIKIGPYWYKIEFRTSRDMQRFDLRGITYADKQLILVSDSLVAGHLRETVLHEVMHACQDVRDRMGVDGDTMDADQFIERTAPTLLEVMRDNPKLVEWFTNGKS